MTIKELAKQLNQLAKDCGDVPVILSSDSEGNSYATTDRQTSVACITDVSDKVVGVCIYPFADGFFEPEEAVINNRR